MTPRSSESVVRLNGKPHGKDHAEVKEKVANS